MVAAAQASRQMVRYFHEKLPSVRSQHPWQTEGRMVQTALSVGRGRQEAALGKKQLSVTSPSPTSTPKAPAAPAPEAAPQHGQKPQRRNSHPVQVVDTSLASIREHAGLFLFIFHSAASYNAKGLWLLQVIRGNTLRNGEGRDSHTSPWHDCVAV